MVDELGKKKQKRVSSLMTLKKGALTNIGSAQCIMRGSLTRCGRASLVGMTERL
jgi:hypothetical protein